LASLLACIFHPSTTFNARSVDHLLKYKWRVVSYRSTKEDLKMSEIRERESRGMRTRPAERVSQTGSSASGRQVAATSTGSARKEASHNTSKPRENGDVAVVTACTASWITNAAQAQRSTAVRRTDCRKVTMSKK
jgi:hypothetical protein